MFFTYLRRELRRRKRQAAIISLGLALGIGLVITVTAASAGVKAAQGTVLQDLYGVGTSATVTQPPAAGSFTPGSGFRSFHFKPGATVKIDQLTADRNLGSLDVSSVTAIAKLTDVAAASGALTANDTNTTFKIPNFTSGSGGFGGGPGGGGGGGGRFSGPGSFGGAGSPVTVNGVDLAAGSQPLGPLSSGTLTSGRTLSSSDADASVAVLDSSYAKSAKLKVGSTFAIASKNFTVVGLVTDPAGDSPADIYIPLQRAQALASPSMTGKVNTIYVAAANAADISAVQKEIKKILPAATVTTSADLASDVTGSLSSAASLANNLGRWLAIAVLAAAFIVASLLTMSAVSRRVREFGTLKALGWRSKRVIGQVLGESVVVGIVGGIVGVGLGFGGAALLAKLSPALTASVGPTTGSATPGGARTFGGGPGGGGFAGRGIFRNAASAAQSLVHLTAPVTLDIIIIAVALAIAGGLIAGMFGGWRAARLRPAAALARVE
jgi:ABC-type antimicrobial peptide transport system permease subunit